MNIINRILTNFGYRIEQYPKGGLKRRLDLFNTFKVDLIFDVGASTGQYAIIQRKLNYRGRIVSFEPLSEYFSLLERNSKNDDKWVVCNYALGDKNTEMLINIAGNSGQSSSFLGMTDAHIKGSKKSKYISNELVKIKTLDSIIDEFNKDDNLFVKIDTQGFERQVLEGAMNSFDKILGFQIELSLTPLYEDSDLYMDIIRFLQQKGYELLSIEPGFTNRKTGRLLQFDGIFFKKGLMHE